jgi:hypothetical protein
LLTVSNLRTSTTPSSGPSSYGLTVSGLTNGPSALDNYNNGDTTTGAFVTTYVSTVARETIISNNFSFLYITLTSGITVVGSPSQNGAKGSLTITFAVGERIPISGSFTIGLPY